MNDNTKATVRRYTEVKVKELCKRLEEKAIQDVEKALNSGAISDESEFLQDNYLLALTVLEANIDIVKQNSDYYKKEKENIILFL